MKWMLVIMVFGASPLKTDLIYSSLDECLRAEEAMRSEYAKSFNAWMKWAQENPSESGFPNSKPAAIRRIGLQNAGTCVPSANASPKTNF